MLAYAYTHADVKHVLNFTTEGHVKGKELLDAISSQLGIPPHELKVVLPKADSNRWNGSLWDEPVNPDLFLWQQRIHGNVTLVARRLTSPKSIMLRWSANCE